MLHIILTIILTISGIMGQPASQPASQPISEAIEAPASFSLAPLKVAPLWASEALASAGVQAPDNVHFLFQNEYNCGAELSQTGQGGCTIKRTDMEGYVILLSPELAYTAWGNHILFHELAHTMGASECEAEYFAHQFEAVALWSYPECQP